MKNLLKTHPGAQITLICRKGVGSLFLREKLVHFVNEVQKGNSQSYRRTLEQLSSKEFDLLLCPHQSLRSAMMALRINAKQKIGFRSWWNGLFFHDRVKRDMSLPEPMRLLKLLSKVDPEIESSIEFWHSQAKLNLGADAADLLPEIPDWANMQIASPATESRQQKPMDQKILGIFPGSTWETKRWTEEGFAEVAKTFINDGWKVVLFGGPDESELCRRMAARIPADIEVTAGLYSIEQSFDRLKSVNLVVTNDNAGQHLASAAGIPCVSIFGPTVLELGFRPWQYHARVVQVNGLDCRPCGLHGHHQCPKGHHRCMKDLKSESVIVAAKNLIQSFSK